MFDLWVSRPPSKNTVADVPSRGDAAKLVSLGCNESVAQVICALKLEVDRTANRKKICHPGNVVTALPACVLFRLNKCQL